MFTVISREWNCAMNRIRSMSAPLTFVITQSNAELSNSAIFYNLNFLQMFLEEKIVCIQKYVFLLIFHM